MVSARKIEKIQGSSSDFRYAEEFSGQSVKFRHNLVKSQQTSVRKLQNIDDVV